MLFIWFLLYPEIDIKNQLNIHDIKNQLNISFNKQVSTLVEEVPQKNDNQDISTIEKNQDNFNSSSLSFDVLRKGLIQLKPMFSKQYLGYSLIVYTMQFCILLG